MIMKTPYLFAPLFFVALVFSCVDDVPSTPAVFCREPVMVTNSSLLATKEKAGFGTVPFEEDLIVAGYVVSDDATGNHYKLLYLQDAPENPKVSLPILIDQTQLHARYPVGRKVFLKLKGLSIGYRFGVLSLGVNQRGTLAPIHSSKIDEHLFRSCEQLPIVPKKAALSELNSSMVGMWVVLEHMQFAAKERGNSYADAGTHSADRMLQQVSENCLLEAEIPLRTSGFSSFKSESLPLEKGTVKALLTAYYSDLQLVLHSPEDLDFSEVRCADSAPISATLGFEEVLQMYQGTLVEFGVEETMVLEGFVISSDRKGNFTKRIVLQDAFENPSLGLQIRTNEEDTHQQFSLGQKVFFKLNRLYMDRVDGVLCVGYTDGKTVEEIEEGALFDFVVPTEEIQTLVPLSKELSELDTESFQNTLVRIEKLQLVAQELGKAYAYYSGDAAADRTLETCGVLQKINLHTEGGASFAHESFPKGLGSITGVLSRSNQKLKVQIRSLVDVEFSSATERCPLIIPKVLLTEIADPQNNNMARFVELYNAGADPIDLEGWSLHKYLNGSSVVSGTPLRLSGVLPPKSFLILANTSFASVFGFTPDIVSSYVSGTGDDVYELVDANQKVHDVFGHRGVDGSNTGWEYTDGKAIRKVEVSQPNSVFELSEWTVFSKANDTAQEAPADFGPKER
jgi:hypothetical protein